MNAPAHGLAHGDYNFRTAFCDSRVIAFYGEVIKVRPVPAAFHNVVVGGSTEEVELHGLLEQLCSVVADAVKNGMALVKMIYRIARCYCYIKGGFFKRSDAAVGRLLIHAAAYFQLVKANFIALGAEKCIFLCGENEPDICLAFIFLCRIRNNHFVAAHGRYCNICTSCGYNSAVIGYLISAVKDIARICKFKGAVKDEMSLFTARQNSHRAVCLL